MMFQVLIGLLIISMDRGFFESSVHVPHLAIRPEMVSVGQPVDDGVLLTDACKDVLEGISILFLTCKLDAVIGKYAMNFVENNYDKIAQELYRHSLDHFSV
jgi:hypothetical protein